MNPVLFLASYANNNTASVILDTTSIAPLWVGDRESVRMGMLVFLLVYMMPLARKRAFGLQRYDVSDWA